MSLLGSNCCPEYYKAYGTEITGTGTRCTSRVTSIDPDLGASPASSEFIYVLKSLFDGQANDKIFFVYNSKSYKIEGDALNTATTYRGSSAKGTTVTSGVSGFATTNAALLGLSNLYIIVCLCRKADYDAMIDSSTNKIDATDHREAFGKRYNADGYAAGSTCSRQQYFAIDVLDSNLTLDGASGAVSVTNKFAVGDYITAAGDLRDGPESSDNRVSAYKPDVGGVSGTATSTLSEDIFRVIDINQIAASNSIYYKDIAAYIEGATVKTKAGSGNEQYFTGCTTCLQAYFAFVKGDSSANTRGLDHVIDQGDNDTLAILNDTPSAWPCRVNFNRVFNIDTYNIPYKSFEAARGTSSVARTFGTKFATPIRTQTEITTSDTVNSNEAYDLTNSKCSESDFNYLDGITGSSTDYFQFNSASDEEVQYASDFSFGLNDTFYGGSKSFSFPPGYEGAFGNAPNEYFRYGSGFRNNRLSIGPNTATLTGLNAPNEPRFLGDETTPQSEVATKAGATATAVTISCEYTRNAEIDQSPTASAACGNYTNANGLPEVNSTNQYLGNTDYYDYTLNSVTITTTGNMAYGDVPIIKWKDCPDDLVQPPVFHKLCDIEDGQRIAQNDTPGDPTSDSRRNFFKFYQSTLDNNAENYLKTNGPENWKNEAFGPQRVYRCSRKGVTKSTVFPSSGGGDDYTITGTATNGDWHKPIQGLTTASNTPLIGYYPTSKSYIGRIFTLHNDGSITPFYKYDYYFSNHSSQGGHQPDGLYAENEAEAKVLNEDMARNGGQSFDVVVPYAPIVEFSGGFNVNGFRKVDKLTANQETACKNNESGQGFGRTDSTDVTAADSISGCGNHSDNDCSTTCAFWPTTSNKSKITAGVKETRGDSLSGIKLCMTDYNTGDLGVDQQATFFILGNSTSGLQVSGKSFYEPYSAPFNTTGRIDTFQPLTHCRLDTLHEQKNNDYCTSTDQSWILLYGTGEIAGGGSGPSIEKLFVNNEDLSVGKRWRLNDTINHAFIYPQNNGFSSFDGTTLTDQKWREESYGFTFMPQYRGNGMWYTVAQLSGDTFERLDDLATRDGFYTRIAKPMMTADSGCVPIDSEYSDVVITAEDPWCRGCTGCLKETVVGDGDNYFPVGDPTDNPTTIL